MAMKLKVHASRLKEFEQGKEDETRKHKPRKPRKRG